MRNRNMRVLPLLIISLAILLNGCFMIVPHQDDIGNTKVFEKDGIQITLTDRFKDTPSEQGFYAYYTSDFCGVMVLREEFTLEEHLAELPLSKYINNAITNNGHTGIKAQNTDGLWYYRYDRSGRCGYCYCYKGSDSFWIVQFVCNSTDEALLKDTFYLWAQSVTVQ